MSARKSDPLVGDHRHANTIRRIHGRRERGLCSSCAIPLTFERGIDECGGRTVASCSGCGWDDFDVQELAWVRSLANDPGFDSAVTA